MRQIYLVSGRQSETKLFYDGVQARALAEKYIGWHEYGCSRTPRRADPEPFYKPKPGREAERRASPSCTCAWPVRVYTDARGRPSRWHRNVFGVNAWSRMEVLDAPRAPSWSWGPWLYLVRTYADGAEAGARLFSTKRGARRFTNDPANDPVERLPAPQ